MKAPVRSGVRRGPHPGRTQARWSGGSCAYPSSHCRGPSTLVAGVQRSNVYPTAALVRKPFSINLLPTVPNSGSRADSCRFRSLRFVIRAAGSQGWSRWRFHRAGCPLHPRRRAGPGPGPAAEGDGVRSGSSWRRADDVRAPGIIRGYAGSPLVGHRGDGATPVASICSAEPALSCTTCLAPHPPPQRSPLCKTCRSKIDASRKMATQTP